MERWRKEKISGDSSGGCLVGSREKELVERWKREKIYQWSFAGRRGDSGSAEGEKR